MWLLLLPLASAIDPPLVRILDPDWPGAEAGSDRASVVLTPPGAGVPWVWEAVPVTDGWPSEPALEALNVGSWHDAGFTGQGVRVAVFDIQWFGAEVDPDELGPVQTADCWSHRSCDVPMDTWRARFGYEQGSHGYACAEIVHDVAPDAELFLVRVNGITTFENATAWAIRNDIDIISMSMSFFNTSFYDGTGPFDPLIRDLEAAGVLLVTSAGNSRAQHWSGPWLDADGDGRFDFAGDNGLDIQLGAGGRRTVHIAWNEYEDCGRSDLDGRMFAPDGSIVGWGDDVQTASGSRCEPNERIGAWADEDGRYRLELEAKRGVAPGLMVDVFTASGSIPEGRETNSIADPAAHPFSFSVGAVRASNYLEGPLQSFSSVGPGRSGSPKPDIVGPDGLDVVAFGAEGFFGTSAATPAVAAAIAVVMSRDPSLSPRDAARQLQAWARSDEAALSGSHDPRMGAGRARLPSLDAESGGCGRGRLWAGLFVPPLWWRRRRTGRDPRASFQGLHAGPNAR